MEQDIFKQCSRCGLTKHSSAFYVARTSKSGLTSRCRECDVQYRADNAERIREQKRKRRAEVLAHLATLPPEERDLADPKRQRWMKYHENNRERINANVAAYKEKNREQVNAHKAERRRRISEATPGWAQPSDFEDFRTIATMFRMYTGQPYDIDHVIPLRGKIAGQLVVCGLHCDSNMTVIPAAENKRKANQRWPDMP